MRRVELADLSTMDAEIRRRSYGFNRRPGERNNRGRIHVPSGAGGGAPAVLGQVATRSSVSGVLGGTLSYMCRTFHYARNTITSIQVAWPNWVVSGGAEVNTGGVLTVRASIEYPAGTFTQLLFSGIAAGTVADGGTLLSDAVAVSIPDGAKFYVRWLWSNVLKIPYHGGVFGPKQYVAGGDAIEQTATDKTLSGTVNDGAIGISMWPCAIIGMTSKRTLAIIGDSRQQGAGDVTTDATGDVGEYERALGPTYAYLNLARSGDTGSGFLASNAKRLALAAYATTIMSGYGFNDLAGGAAAVQATLTSLKALFPGKPYYQSTLPPQSTSTDAWATVVNQTTTGTNATRVTVNNWIRANSAGFTGTPEIADFEESARDSGLWKAPGYTADGTHETSFGNQQIVISL